MKSLTVFSMIILLNALLSLLELRDLLWRLSGQRKPVSLTYKPTMRANHAVRPTLRFEVFAGLVFVAKVLC